MEENEALVMKPTNAYKYLWRKDLSLPENLYKIFTFVISSNLKEI